MKLEALTSEWERHEAELQLEYYKQYAGLGVSEAWMQEIAGEIERLATQGLATLPREALPPLLWQAMVANRSAREITKLAHEIYEQRNGAVKIEIAGESVNLNNVRLFNHKHLREPQVRKQAFDALCEKARVITPTLERRFRLSASIWRPFGMTPLDAYLVEEQLSLSKLEETVDGSGRSAKPAFEKAAAEFSDEILGKPFEYYDDMYVFRHAIYNPVDPHFASVDFVREFVKLATHLGFRPQDIMIDGKARSGKFSSPVCFGVKVPGDVRVLYQKTSPLGDYESFYHEMGHAVHFASVGPTRPFTDRRLIQSGVAEIFSTLFEELSMDPVYLRDDLGMDLDAVTEVLRRRRFMELYFLTFYAANSMHKIRFWKEALHEDFARADKAYGELYQKYVGPKMPGIYWQTHHVLSMSDMYAPSYLLANIRKSEVVRLLQREFGRAWWRDPRSGGWLREHGTGPGAAIDLANFSTLDARAYVEPVVKGRTA